MTLIRLQAYFNAAPGRPGVYNPFDHRKGSHCTCPPCLLDAGCRYSPPGTLAYLNYNDHPSGPGCQSCVQHADGTTRCTGCWLGPWPNGA
jgi:hypothetical protein